MIYSKNRGDKKWSKSVSGYVKTKQGRIVHRSCLNNENYENQNEKYKKTKIKDFIYNSTMVKADIC